MPIGYSAGDRDAQVSCQRPRVRIAKAVRSRKQLEIATNDPPPVDVEDSRERTGGG